MQKAAEGLLNNESGWGRKRQAKCSDPLCKRSERPGHRNCPCHRHENVGIEIISQETGYGRLMAMSRSRQDPPPHFAYCEIKPLPYIERKINYGCSYVLFCFPDLFSSFLAKLHMTLLFTDCF